jgi:hypothetical protein
VSSTFNCFRTLVLSIAFLLTTTLLTLLYPAPARAQGPITPWYPTFVCPDRITLWDDLEQLIELGEPNLELLRVKEWTLFFQSRDGKEYASLTGAGPIVFDDRNNLREDMDYDYLLRYIYDARDKKTGETHSYQATITYRRHTEPYCYGQVHSNYAFNERHYYFMSFSVWEGNTLTVPAGATLERYQSGGEIHVGYYPDTDVVVEGELISATLVVGGNQALLTDAHVSGGGARVFDGGALQMNGGTLAQAKITVYTGTVTLDGVTGGGAGSVDFEQWPGANVQVQNSTLAGSFYVKSNAALVVYNSTLTGTVRAGPGGITSNPVSQATLISTTILAPDDCYPGLVSSERDAVVTLNRYRIDTRGKQSCYAVDTYGGQTRLWYGSIDGPISASGDSRLEAYRLDMKGNGRVAHDLGVRTGARVDIAASRLDSLNKVYIWPGGRVTITDSSLISSTVFVDGDQATAGVTLLRNDFTYLPQWYLLWFIKVPPHLLTVRDNCFYCQNALRVEAPVPVHLEENYWNHPLGPNFPPANRNPDGAGISESVAGTVIFQPFLDAEPAYCRQWPRPAPHTAEGLVGPAGGTVTAPGTVLVFPPGAVAQDAAITWSQGEEALAGAEAAAPEAATLLGRYRLTAASAATPSQLLGFQKPVTLTLFYDQALLGGAAEASLTLRRWTGAGWVPLAGTTVAVADDSLQAMLPEPGSYGLFGAVEVHNAYLPLCVKAGR